MHPQIQYSPLRKSRWDRSYEAEPPQKENPRLMWLNVNKKLLQIEVSEKAIRATGCQGTEF